MRPRPASVVLLVLLALVLLAIVAFFGLAWYSEIDPIAPLARSSFDHASNASAAPSTWVALVA